MSQQSGRTRHGRRPRSETRLREGRRESEDASSGGNRGASLLCDAERGGCRSPDRHILLTRNLGTTFYLRKAPPSQDIINEVHSEPQFRRVRRSRTSVGNGSRSVRGRGRTAIQLLLFAASSLPPAIIVSIFCTAPLPPLFLPLLDVRPFPRFLSNRSSLARPSLVRACLAPTWTSASHSLLLGEHALPVRSRYSSIDGSRLDRASWHLLILVLPSPRS